MDFETHGTEFFIETLHSHFKGPEPAFFDKSSFPWAVELERNSTRIIDNISALLDDKKENYGKLGRIQAEEKYFFPPGIQNWKGYYFYYNGIRIKQNLKAFPVLAEELSKIPNLVTANIAVLEPHTKILAHRGTTNGFIRCHLGLKIPGQIPLCGFVVNGVDVNWNEGKLWMFGDMCIHWGYNNTDSRRYILMLDVVRPGFLAYKKLLCVHQLSKYMASVTGDYLRTFFKVAPPVLSNDPYNPAKSEAKEVRRSKRETRGQKIIRKTEDWLFQIYKIIFWVIYSFKRLQ